MAAEARLMGAMAANLFLGVDGGGSRCRARLETADGRALGQGEAGPASMRFGIEATSNAILAATRQALREANLPEEALQRVHAGIGVAGTGLRGARDALESWRHPFAGAWFEGDGYLALLGAFGGGAGGVVIAGTGSIGLCYQDKTVRVGGYGFPVSDQGSGADLGLNAIRHALKTLDGRAAPSAFSRELLDRFEGDPAALSAWNETADATEYATLAPIVVRHAQAGDAAAQRLMHQAGAEIAALIEALVASGAPRVALLGGLAPFIRAYLPAETAAHLAAPQADAMAGGILLAKKRLSEAAARRP